MNPLSSFFNRRFKKPYLVDLSLLDGKPHYRAIFSSVLMTCLFFAGLGFWTQMNQMDSPVASAFLAALGVVCEGFAVAIGYYFVRWGRFKYPYPSVRALKRFIEQNGLFERGTETRLDRNGKEHRKPVVLSSARFEVMENDVEIRVWALKDADRFQAKMGDLAESLSALFALPLYEKKEDLTSFLYVFRRKQSERLALADVLQGSPCRIPLMSDLVWDVAKQPHALICGGTGSGKTVMIDVLILAFLTRMKRDAALYSFPLFVADPKNSDLGQLQKVLGENVGTTPGAIARLVRRCTETMENRYAEMGSPENFRYGSDWRDHGYVPCVLFFDELAAFKASCDKKIFAEVMASLTAIILKGRQAGCFVVLSAQQPRAEVLPTDLRDQLGMRVMLGNAAGREILSMVFGNVDVSDLRTVAGAGEGHILLDGLGWTAPRPFCVPFCDFSKVDFLETVRRLVLPSEPVCEASGDASSIRESVTA